MYSNHAIYWTIAFARRRPRLKDAGAPPGADRRCSIAGSTKSNIDCGGRLARQDERSSRQMRRTGKPGNHSRCRGSGGEEAVMAELCCDSTRDRIHG
jgi:hypothetical protein